MPPETKCPVCMNLVPDWHFEWHVRQDQADIFAGKKMMECPLCRAGVGFDGFLVTKTEPAQVLAKRDLWQAVHWARSQNKSLRDYLKTREGEPYVKSWSETEIESADERAAAE